MRTWRSMSDFLDAFRSKGKLAPWRYALLWAFGAGALVQLLLGLFATIVCLMLLVAAERCPAALPERPFFAWAAGVALAIALYEEGTIFGIFHVPGSTVIWDPFFTGRWRA